jgi:fructose-1,6-bisphosphatase/inositol monophosphatase family enzyme
MSAPAVGSTFHTARGQGACLNDKPIHPSGVAERVTVQFTVSVTGAVSSSDLASSTLDGAHIEKCVVNAVRGWEFPRTMGGRQPHAACSPNQACR